MTLDGKILRGLFEFERIKPATLRTSHGNVNTLATIEASAKFRNNPIEMQMLKHLNPFCKLICLSQLFEFYGNITAR